MKSQYSNPRSAQNVHLEINRPVPKLCLLCWHTRQDGTGFPSVRPVFSQDIAQAVVNSALNERTGVKLTQAHLMDLQPTVPKLVKSLLP